MPPTIVHPDESKIASRTAANSDQNQSVSWSEWVAALMAVAIVVALVMLA